MYICIKRGERLIQHEQAPSVKLLDDFDRSTPPLGPAVDVAGVPARFLTSGESRGSLLAVIMYMYERRSII